MLYGPCHDGEPAWLAVAGKVTHANGTAERRALETMLKARRKASGRRITAGEDKAYDTAGHVPKTDVKLGTIAISTVLTDTVCDEKATDPVVNLPADVGW